jgi:cell fate (sporulation/competence/biofilm development) regulator YlbF (YheA/YmcA/DUF963 family)
MTIQQLADGVRTRLRATAQHNHSGCRSRQEHQNLQQFFSDLNAMTAQAVLEFRISCSDCGGQEISLERARELVNQAQSLDEWEELFDLEQHLNHVIGGHYH